MILLMLAYAFFSTSFKYLTYPKYSAVVDGYSEYNSTNDDGDTYIMYDAIYKFDVDGKVLRETNKQTSSSSKPKVGRKQAVCLVPRY